MSRSHGVFCTAVNCMDGRKQCPVSDFLMARFRADFVDTVTEPGPNRILAEGADAAAVASILRRVGISVSKHGSRVVAVVGHHDCAGNPAGREGQLAQLRLAAAVLKRHFPDVEVVAVWVDEHWRATAVPLTA